MDTFLGNLEKEIHEQANTIIDINNILVLLQKHL